ncbi:MAG: hypothetical protein E7264_08545 [Lachnospiraceae bacterium]|nr:hypothetical protein [Lachnospiraceae bacterium]
MQSIHILDIKPFMQLLFQTDLMNQYLLVSASITTDLSYTIDGHIQSAFFNEDELDALGIQELNYMPWSIAKEKIFHLIKGKKTPTQLKLVLKVSEQEERAIFTDANSSLNSNDINGLYLNILFQENQLNVICGISYHIFTLDKQIEQEFSDKIITFFKSNNITCA